MGEGSSLQDRSLGTVNIAARYHALVALLSFAFR